MKSIKWTIFIIVIAAALTLFMGGCSDEKPNYEIIRVPATIVKVTDCPYVRSDPVRGDKETPNSFGTVATDGFTMEVTCYYKTDHAIDFHNGEYYGFSVEEILATPEGTEWFPGRIKNDSDGIVWINHQYVEIIL